jgi:hypothetical protein
MADQLDPEQIARASEALEQLINGFGKTKTSAEQVKDAQERFGKDLGKAAANLGSSLFKGEKGVGQFGDAVEAAANAIQVAILAIPGIGIAAKLATVAMVALAKGINAAAKQGDALYKSYQDLGRAGATAADGISGVFRNMQNLGYGIEELDKMVALVTQNSETLAKFSLTAADGTNAFAEGMAQIQRDGGLRLLGKTTDDINSAGAAFIRQQITMGRTQKDVGDSLGAKTKQYILDLDRLQRLTGTSADALQKQQEDLLSEDAYNVYMKSLEDQGAAGEAQKKKIEEVTARLPMYEKMIAQAIGGNVEAQQQLFFIAPDLIKDLRDPVKSTADTLKTFNTQATNADKAFSGLAALGGGTRDVVGSISDLRKSIAATSDIDARNDAAAKNAVVLDKGTKAITEAQIANMNSRDAMQAFIQKGVAPATTALATLAKAASGATSLGARAVGVAEGGAAKSSPAGMGKMDYSKELYGGGAKGYLEKMVQAESGGRNIANQSGAGGAATSSAFGLAQITKGTFEGLVSKAGQNNPLYGKTFDDMKSDTKLQMEAARQLTDQNRQFLESRKLPTSDAALYLAHFLGPGGAARALSQADNSPLSSAVDPNQLAANPMLQKMSTVADLKNWADQKMGGGGFRDGGIASGPTSGYSATLHGTEAVVPLPNGKTIPVEMAGFNANFSDQTSLMSQQLDKLDELVRVMQNQVSVSTKILQAAN